jgi:class 3 adenylate cyclase
MRRDGRLIYANAASEPLHEAFGRGSGGIVPEPLRGRLIDAADEGRRRSIEVVAGLQTFAVLAVAVGGSDIVNVYGTDITGAKVVERFPERNPNPVMRMSPDGTLIYANEASGPIVRGHGFEVGRPLPADIRDSCLEACRVGDTVELAGEGRIFAFKPVLIAEFDFINLYGTDITALRAMDKFPDRNPNPVLRVGWDGRLTYANPASEPVCRQIGGIVGDRLPADFFERVTSAVSDDGSSVIEVEVDGRTFDLLVVSLYEFESINLYGTEVTAARAVERANRENERLLLSILPPSIAERLKQGEVVIADRFDEMTVLFADCVGFTELSAGLTPAELVILLNDIFSVFDRLVDRDGLEKIKTIGDAYMVVGGLEEGGSGEDGRRHVSRVADLALDMLAAVDAYRTADGRGLQVRIGIHAGPAVGGVIGLKKFIYDVWGDAVNMASRMESQGVAGCIQVSAETYDRLRNEFAFRERGDVEIKGKGRIRTYLLTGRLDGDGLAAASLGVETLAEG